MSKPAKSSYKERKPFVATDRLKIHAIEEEGRIIRFECTVDGVDYIEEVKGNQILKAFQRIEKHCAKL